MEQIINPVITEPDHGRLVELLDRLRLEGPDPEADVDTLGQRLARARLVSPDRAPRSLVTMNSLVGLRDLERNQKMTLRLVYPEEADVVKHHASVASPLGAQLIGSGVGQFLECPTPSGSKKLRVEAVYYQPEAARDFHL